MVAAAGLEAAVRHRDGGGYLEQFEEAHRAANCFNPGSNVFHMSQRRPRDNRVHEHARGAGTRRRPPSPGRSQGEGNVRLRHRRAVPSSGTQRRAQAGWRIRTFLVDAGAGIIVVWVDRGQTDLEKRAVMITMSTGRNYDEVLEEVRRHNLRPVEDA
jgi:hypothetical protein